LRNNKPLSSDLCGFVFAVSRSTSSSNMANSSRFYTHNGCPKGVALTSRGSGYGSVRRSRLRPAGAADSSLYGIGVCWVTTELVEEHFCGKSSKREADKLDPIESIAACFPLAKLERGIETPRSRKVLSRLLIGPSTVIRSISAICLRSYKARLKKR
jgi:hypothetical protein